MSTPEGRCAACRPVAWPIALISLLLLMGCSSAFGAQGGETADCLQGVYRLVPAGLHSADGAAVPSLAPLLSLRAAGTGSARIVDREGKTFRKAPPGGTIFSFNVSPSGRHVLLHLGDANYTVAAADTLIDVLRLPAFPAGHADATAITWHLIDDDYLVGEAELPSTQISGGTAAELEALPPRATLLYIYELENRSLTPVEIDAAVPPAFSIHQVSGWNITLLTHDSAELMGAAIVRAMD